MFKQNQQKISYTLLFSIFMPTLITATYTPGSVAINADQPDAKALYPSASNIVANTISVLGSVTIKNNADIYGDITAKNIIAKEKVQTVSLKLDTIEKNGNIVSWPTTTGAQGTYLGSDGEGNLVYSTPKGDGNVTTRDDFTTQRAVVITAIVNDGNKNVAQTNVTIDAENNISGVKALNATTVNSNLVGNVTGNVTGNLIGNATGNLTGNVTGNLTGDVTGKVTGNVTGNLIGDVTGKVTGDVTGNLIGNATGNLTGNVTGNLVGDVTGKVTGDVTGNLTGNATGNLTGNVTGNLVGDVTGKVTGDVTGNITGNLTGDVKGDVEGMLAGDVVGNVIGNVTGNLTGNVTGRASENLLKAGDTMLGALAVMAATSATNPSIIFANDTATGIYSTDTNKIGLSTAGTEKLVVDATAVNLKSATYLNGQKTFDLTVKSATQETANTIYVGATPYNSSNAISLTSALTDENDLYVFLDFGTGYLGRMLMIYNSSATAKTFILKAGAGYTITDLDENHTLLPGKCILLIGVDGGNWVRL